MIELISIAGALLVCILTPIEIAKIRGGWVRKKFAGNREQFLLAYRKQLTLLVWLGGVFGVLSFGLAFLASDPPGEWIVKLISAVLWLAVCVVALVSRRSLDSMPLGGTQSG